jgi:hypothetical protein
VVSLLFGLAGVTGGGRCLVSGLRSEFWLGREDDDSCNDDVSIRRRSCWRIDDGSGGLDGTDGLSFVPIFSEGIVS